MINDLITKNLIDEAQKKYMEIFRKHDRTPEGIAELEKAREEFSRLFGEQEKELLHEILQNGIKIDSLSDLMHTRESYPEIIDVLIKHLTRNYHKEVIETIVRSLAVKEARGKAFQPLLRLYNSWPKEDDDFRWVIGNTMGYVATKDDLKDIEKIILDRSNANSRARLIGDALIRIKPNNIEEILKKIFEIDNLLNDLKYPIISVEVLDVIRKLKLKQFKREVEELLNSKNKNIAKAAKKALLKIG
ncbi:MAG: hypothetical protein NG784_15685 [Candidatus Jettenia sp.]|nr:hypothetical protein [Candidatus Jettenia sp.]